MYNNVGTQRKVIFLWFVDFMLREVKRNKIKQNKLSNLILITIFLNDF